MNSAIVLQFQLSGRMPPPPPLSPPSRPPPWTMSDADGASIPRSPSPPSSSDTSRFPPSLPLSSRARITRRMDPSSFFSDLAKHSESGGKRVPPASASASGFSSVSSSQSVPSVVVYRREDLVSGIVCGSTHVADILVAGWTFLWIRQSAEFDTYAFASLALGILATLGCEVVHAFVSVLADQTTIFEAALSSLCLWTPWMVLRNMWEWLRLDATASSSNLSVSNVAENPHPQDSEQNSSSHALERNDIFRPAFYFSEINSLFWSLTRFVTPFFLLGRFLWLYHMADVWSTSFSSMLILWNGLAWLFSYRALLFFHHIKHVRWEQIGVFISFVRLSLIVGGSFALHHNVMVSFLEKRSWRSALDGFFSCLHASSQMFVVLLIVAIDSHWILSVCLLLGLLWTFFSYLFSTVSATVDSKFKDGEEGVIYPAIAAGLELLTTFPSLKWKNKVSCKDGSISLDKDLVSFQRKSWILRASLFCIQGVSLFEMWYPARGRSALQAYPLSISVWSLFHCLYLMIVAFQLFLSSSCQRKEKDN